MGRFFKSEKITNYKLRKMKIIFDHQIFSMQAYGGISRYFVELTKILTSGSEYADVDASILVYLNRNKYLEEVSKTVNYKNWASFTFFGAGKVFFCINSVICFFVSFFISPDIVHKTYYANQPFLRKKAKVVLTVYDMIHEIYPQFFKGSREESRKKKLAVEEADVVICISKVTQRDLVRYFGIDKKKTRVVPLGFSPLGERFFAKHESLGVDDPYILYVGSRVGYKNFEVLVRAYAENFRLRQAFKLVCFGGGVFRDAEKMFFESLGLGDEKVQQVSGDDNQLFYAYKGAAVFVYPSLYEGFGIPPLEAMSLGCPVVCSWGGSIAEVVGDAAVLVDPMCTSSLSNGLEQALFNPSVRKAKVDAGFKRIKNFSWELCAERTSKIYRELLQ